MPRKTRSSTCACSGSRCVRRRAWRARLEGTARNTAPTTRPPQARGGSSGRAQLARARAPSTRTTSPTPRSRSRSPRRANRRVRPERRRERSRRRLFLLRAPTRARRAKPSTSRAACRPCASPSAPSRVRHRSRSSPTSDGATRRAIPAPSRGARTPRARRRGRRRTATRAGARRIRRLSRRAPSGRVPRSSSRALRLEIDPGTRRRAPGRAPPGSRRGTAGAPTRPRRRGARRRLRAPSRRDGRRRGGATATESSPATMRLVRKRRSRATRGAARRVGGTGARVVRTPNA